MRRTSLHCTVYVEHHDPLDLYGNWYRVASAAWPGLELALGTPWFRIGCFWPCPDMQWLCQGIKEAKG